MHRFLKIIFTLYFMLEYSRLTNNIVIAPGTQQRTQPYIYMYPFHPKLLSHLGCYTTLRRVPCAVHQDLKSHMGMKKNVESTKGEHARFSLKIEQQDPATCQKYRFSGSTPDFKSETFQKILVFARANTKGNQCQRWQHMGCSTMLLSAVLITFCSNVSQPGTW